MGWDSDSNPALTVRRAVDAVANTGQSWGEPNSSGADPTPQPPGTASRGPARGTGEPNSGIPGRQAPGTRLANSLLILSEKCRFG